MPDIARKHHFLVRLTHWANIPILLALIASGLSIYWAAPVFRNAAGRDHFGKWFYDHFSLGTFDLARALRLHWLFAYLFMANAVLYVVGLAMGGGWRDLMPRRGDVREMFAMIGYYLRIRKQHPPIATKYNALQKSAYVSVPLAGVVAILSGWAMHKPVQLRWLERLFGSYDGARGFHFAMLWVFVLFVIPHVVLVIVDGWDTFRSMVVGWSERAHG